MLGDYVDEGGREAEQRSQGKIFHSSAKVRGAQQQQYSGCCCHHVSMHVECEEQSSYR